MRAMIPLRNSFRAATKEDSASAGAQRYRGAGWLSCLALLMSPTGQTCSNRRRDDSCISVTTDSRVTSCTRRGGNKLLRACFEALHSGVQSRLTVPPFFVFSRASERRDVQFKGLAVPGAEGVPATDDLVAIWRTSDGLRFQNYRAVFTILDAPVVSREWINRVVAGDPADGAPSPWLDWRYNNCGFGGGP